MAVPAKITISRAQHFTGLIYKGGTGFALRFMHVVIERIIFIGTMALRA
jgi:hypothetical protein